MQIVHCSPYRDVEGKPRNDKKRQAAKALGSNWLARLKSEDTVIEAFGNHLDDDYHLICNADLLEDGPDADLVLFGPSGVWVFEFIHEGGSFRAEGEEWLALNSKTAEYGPVEPNPVASARDNANAVYDYLHSKDLPIPWVNPVLVLTHPDTNLQNDGAAVSAIRAEEAYQFVTQEVRDLNVVMNEEDIGQVYYALTPFFVDSLPADSAEGEVSARPTHFMGMTTVQWVVILGLAVMDICLLGSFAWLVISRTQ